jgi:hypothetical protein
MIRIKMRQMPGDVPKRVKIQMMEGRACGHVKWNEGDIPCPACKIFRRVVRARERAVLKGRTQKEIRGCYD